VQLVTEPLYFNIEILLQPDQDAPFSDVTKRSDVV
jgi:hypothetical protein